MTVTRPSSAIETKTLRVVAPAVGHRVAAELRHLLRSAGAGQAHGEDEGGGPEAGEKRRDG